MVLHLVVCVILVLVVLLQSGKDGGIGAMAGGSSQTVFGSSGGANFFTRFTAVVAAIFMVTSLGLTITKGGKRSSIFDNPAQPNSAAVPGAPSAPEKAPTENAPAPTDQKKE